MLKIEKSSLYAPIELRLREKESFFNSLLLKALALALFLHSGAFLLFHIEPFKITTSFLFSPVHVQVEQNHLLVAPLLLEQQSEEMFDFSHPPLWIAPDPLLFPSSHWQSTNLFPESKEALFSSLEQRFWPSMNFPILFKKPALQLFISGELAAHAFIKEPLLLKEEVETISSDPLYVNYRVRVEEQEGTIFWYERTQKSGKPKIDRLTEDILLTLQFDPGSLSSVSEGTLHFVIYEPL
jgi:hypothetical protein